MLSPEQIRFLRLHALHVVERSQWLFQGGTLRAQAGRVVATITARGLGELVDKGLCEPIGCAGVKLTERGRAAA